MKERLEDFKLLLKNDRRIWAVAGFIVVIIFLGTFASKEKRQRPQIDMSASSVQNQGMGMAEAYRDLTVAFRQDIENLTKASKEQSQVIKRVGTEIREHKQRSTGIFESIVDRLEELGKAVDGLEKNKSTGASVEVDRRTGEPLAANEPDGLESFEFTKADVPPPPAPPQPTRVSVISPGDAVQLELLTGVNAPVDGTPYPVVFKLAGAITGPDGSSLDLGEGRLIAAATGSEVDGRALFRMTDLSIRHRDGRRSVVKVDGWIVGEDGVRGLQGTLIDKLGQLILTTAGVSAMAALGTSLENQASGLDFSSNTGDINISTDDLQYAGVSAITDASNRLGQVLLDRYEKLVPVVEILSGRKVTAIFSQPAEVEIIDDSEEGADIFTASLN